jgi:hypothetical protein
MLPPGVGTLGPIKGFFGGGIKDNGRWGKFKYL